jgi:PIN domain nuclease of toxin-antitoxin system
MRILLDTQVVIKIIYDENDIDTSFKNDVEYFQHHYIVSTVTLHEFVILKSLGKIETRYSLDEFVNALYSKQFELLAITPKHLSQLEKLPYLVAPYLYDKILFFSNIRWELLGKFDRKLYLCAIKPCKF